MKLYHVSFRHQFCLRKTANWLLVKLTIPMTHVASHVITCLKCYNRNRIWFSKGS